MSRGWKIGLGAYGVLVVGAVAALVFSWQRTNEAVRKSREARDAEVAPGRQFALDEASAFTSAEHYQEYRACKEKIESLPAQDKVARRYTDKVESFGDAMRAAGARDWVQRQAQAGCHARDPKPLKGMVTVSSVVKGIVYYDRLAPSVLSGERPKTVTVEVGYEIVAVKDSQGHRWYVERTAVPPVGPPPEKDKK
jgi:hypothetical protein